MHRHYFAVPHPEYFGIMLQDKDGHNCCSTNEGYYKKADGTFDAASAQADCSSALADDMDYISDPYDCDPEFADPTGRSALRAETQDNPRNLPCPTCGQPDRLTPKDRALGYQCDSCADRAEMGFDF
jgi:hypothetical protein